MEPSRVDEFEKIFLDRWWRKPRGPAGQKQEFQEMIKDIIAAYRNQRKALARVKGYFVDGEGCSRCDLAFEGEEFHVEGCLVLDINEILYSGD